MDREGTDVYGKETCMEKEIVSFCRNKRKMGWEVKGMNINSFLAAAAGVPENIKVKVSTEDSSYFFNFTAADYLLTLAVLISAFFSD